MKAATWPRGHPRRRRDGRKLGRQRGGLGLGAQVGGRRPPFRHEHRARTRLIVGGCRLGETAPVARAARRASRALPRHSDLRARRAVRNPRPPLACRLPLDEHELVQDQRARGRTPQRLLKKLPRLVQHVRPARLAPGLDERLHQPELDELQRPCTDSRLDRAPDALHGRNRVGVAFEGEVRLRLAEPGGHVLGRRGQYGVEALERRLRMPVSQLNESERRLRRVELRQPLEQIGEFACAPAQIARLETRPGVLVLLLCDARRLSAPAGMPGRP